MSQDSTVRIQIADVLEESIGHGILDEKTALAFWDCAYETTVRSPEQARARRNDFW